MTDRDTITLPREVVELALDALEWSWGGEPMGTKEREAITALRTHLAAEQPKPTKPHPLIPLHQSDCALLLGGYQCTCGFRQRQNKTPTALAAEPQKPSEVGELIENLMDHAYNDGVKQLKYRSSQTVEAEEALRTHLAAEQPKPEPGLMELARQMKPLDADMAAILHDNLDSLYIEDEPALAAEPTKPSDSLKAMKEAFRILTKPESGYLRWQVSDACDILRTAIRTAPPDAEALRRDAERYRWLRERAWFQDEFEGRYGDSGETVQELDAAIDAAIKEGKR